MNPLNQFITAIALSSSATLALASPILLITHNTTDVESNAYVAGTIASQHPSKPHSDNKVSWVSVRMACFGHTVNGKCPALIKLATNTPNPIDIGTVTMDLNSGDIMPKQLSANGYTLIVNGPGETTLMKD
jgi:hypothetical protein